MFSKFLFTYIQIHEFFITFLLKLKLIYTRNVSLL